FNLNAGANHSLNLVETTPEDPASLKEDMHASEGMGFKPVPGVPEGNMGWTSQGGSGPMTRLEFIESGPLRGKVRLTRTNEIWELAWTAESRALIWRLTTSGGGPADGASRPQLGFRFTAISASPYLPFDRCVDGSEYHWPNCPDDEEPPDHEFAPRQWPKLPGSHAVYYNHAENYGALGIVSLDTNLIWTGIGS